MKITITLLLWLGMTIAGQAQTTHYVKVAVSENPECPEALIVRHSSSMRIYPNPASHYLDIHLENTLQELRLFSMSGQLVRTHRQVAAHFRMELAGIPEGVYLLQITTTANTFHHQILIRK